MTSLSSFKDLPWNFELMVLSWDKKKAITIRNLSFFVRNTIKTKFQSNFMISHHELRGALVTDLERLVSARVRRVAHGWLNAEDFISMFLASELALSFIGAHPSDQYYVLKNNDRLEAWANTWERLYGLRMGSPPQSFFVDICPTENPSRTNFEKRNGFKRLLEVARRYAVEEYAKQDWLFIDCEWNEEKCWQELKNGHVNCSRNDSRYVQSSKNNSEIYLNSVIPYIEIRKELEALGEE